MREERASPAASAAKNARLFRAEMGTQKHMRGRMQAASAILAKKALACVTDFGGLRRPRHGP
jgi:hypothetical protein